MPTLQEDGSYREDRWPRGIDNRSHRGRVAEGCVADAVNVMPTTDGSLTLRPRARQAYAGVAVRGALAVGHMILLADGDKLVEYNSRTGGHRQLRTIDLVGQFAGAVLNEELFFCTATEVLRYKAGVVRRWGVPTAEEATVGTVSGAAPSQPGRYRVATTLVNEFGEEGGVYAAQVIDVAEGLTLVVTPPTPVPGHVTRVYVSSPNGETMYLQAEDATTPLMLSRVRDDTLRMVTEGETPPEPGQWVAATMGTLAVATGSAVWLTNPLRPHSRRYAERFFQYSASVGMLEACAGGLFVSADKTYFLSEVDGECSQRAVLDYPAIAGTGVQLGGRSDTASSHRVGWMTPYGLAVGSPGGAVELPSEDRFAPRVGDAGGSGVVESDGMKAVVTTMRGQTGRNPLAARDYFEVEVI